MRVVMTKLEAGFLRRFARMSIMSDEPNEAPAKDQSSFATEVGVKAARKLNAQAHPAKGVWFGLGMMGLIGWSVSVPTLLGAGAWPLARPASSGEARVDAGAAGCRTCDRVL